MSNMNRLPGIAMSTIAAAIALPNAALAHHAMDGILPATFAQGLLSGLGHPIIGLDHFAYVIGIGVVAAVAGLGVALPLLFVAFMCAGLSLHFTGLNIPANELLIAMSVILVGAAVVWSRVAAGAALAASALFAIAGTLHGYAFAESIIGAEATPLAAYVLGLVVVQSAIALGAYALTRAVLSETLAVPRGLPRAAGAMIMLAGVYFAAGAAGVLG